MDDKSTKSYIEPIISILQTQAIPCWERYGTERLAVTKKTLGQFKKGLHSELIQTSVKKRTGKKERYRNPRNFNNTSSTSEFWVDDDQATYRYPALIFIFSGQADFHVADYVIHCPSGHFLLFESGVPRPLGRHPHLDGDNALQRKNSILWFFAPPGTNSVTAYICHSEGKKHWSDGYNIVHRPEVLHLYKTLVREIEECGKFIDLCFPPFLHFYLRELQKGQFHQTGSVSSVNQQKAATSPIEQARQYIKTHLNQSLTAENVAAEVYMSRRNFLHHWSRESTQTFHEFVTEQRMEEAGRLLRDGYWSVRHICRFIGLQPTQFRAQFQKFFGINPSQFRKNPTKSARKR